MTTIFAVNGIIAADQNHASYQNEPRYTAQKLHESEYSSMIGAIYGDSRVLADTYLCMSLLEIYIYRAGKNDKELNELGEKALKELQSQLGYDTLVAIAKHRGDIATYVVDRDSVDIPWREDGVAFGTGAMIAKSWYHRQKQKGEFDMREIMGMCLYIDPQSCGGYNMKNGEALFDMKDITKEDILASAKKAGIL